MNLVQKNLQNIASLPRNDKGRWGELRAAYFLARKGFTLVSRNWACGRYELDLVARRGPLWVFVEVRTCQEDTLSGGYYSIGQKKKEALAAAIHAYIARHRRAIAHWQLDIIEVKGFGQTQITHYEGVKSEKKWPCDGYKRSTLPARQLSWGLHRYSLTVVTLYGRIRHALGFF